MNFSDFINQTGFAPTYAAHSLLYKPNSRPVLLAKSLKYQPSETELKDMRRLIAGKKEVYSLFPDLKKAS